MEVWKCLVEVAVDFLTRLFNRILEIDKLPDEWMKSVLVPIYKKGDVQGCTNYRGIKLMNHIMKIWERALSTATSTLIPR